MKYYCSFYFEFLIWTRWWTRGKIRRLRSLWNIFPHYTRKISISYWLAGSKLQRTRKCSSEFGRILSSLGRKCTRFGRFHFRSVLFLSVKISTVRPRQYYYVGEAPLSLRVAIITYMVSKGSFWVIALRIGWAFWIGSSQHSQAYILHKQLMELGNLVYDTVLFFLTPSNNQSLTIWGPQRPSKPMNLYRI